MEKDDWDEKFFDKKMRFIKNDVVQRDDFADTHIDQLVELGPLP